MTDYCTHTSRVMRTFPLIKRPLNYPHYCGTPDIYKNSRLFGLYTCVCPIYTVRHLTEKSSYFTFFFQVAHTGSINFFPPQLVTKRSIFFYQSARARANIGSSSFFHSPRYCSAPICEIAEFMVFLFLSLFKKKKEWWSR